MDDFLPKIDYFVRKLRSRDNSVQININILTVKFISQIMKQQPITSSQHIKDLILTIGSLGKKFQQLLPTQITLGNLSRRILHIIRTESDKAGVDLTIFRQRRVSSLSQLLLGRPDQTCKISYQQTQKNILRQISQLKGELQQQLQQVAQQSLQFIQSNDIILTYGFSNTLLKFFKHAAAQRDFQVIVAQAAPLCTGQNMAKALSEAKIKSTLIADQCIFALMSRVNKVVIGTKAVMANGGLITHSGVYGICLAANQNSVPVLVACGLVKLSPLYPVDQDTINQILSPTLIAEMPNEETAELVCVSVPAMDYVPSQLVSLYITNVGSLNPSYIYRLLTEYYSPEDYYFKN